MPTPRREIAISGEIVHRLLVEQRPDLADSEITIVAEGWDNVTARIGGGMAVRLPRREVAADLIVREQQWLPMLEPRLPVAIPAPLWCGEPTDFYPYRWSVVPWFDGEVAAEAPLRAGETGAVGRALRALHVAAPSDAPANPFRDRPLAAYANLVTGRLETAKAKRIDLGVAIPDAESLWHETHRTEIDHAAVWVHADLHPKNVITRDGRLVAIVDWGDLTVGDPAVDLSAIWSLFDRDAHESFWGHYGYVSEATKARARAWALHFALVWIVEAADVDPLFADMGRWTLARLLD